MPQGIGGSPEGDSFAFTEENSWESADKAQNKAEDLGGKAKEAAGSATGDRDLEDEGQRRPGDLGRQGCRREGQGRRLQHQGQAHVIFRSTWTISATGDLASAAFR